MSHFYVTSPIYYVNDKPHLGHAYTSIACDTLARFARADGKTSMFLTGTDEHGLKVKQAAESRGVTPQAYTDEVSTVFQGLSDLLNLSNDDFIRTTQDRHKRGVSALWDILVEKGEIYLDKYSGWYAVRDEAYYGEDELTTTPDGKKIAPSGAECAWVEEASYFFRLSAWQDRLMDFYAKNPGFVAPESRFNEVKSFVKGGLKDLSVSRTTFDWGIPVPNAPGHVMYVWIDALANYLSALGFPDNTEKMQGFWPEAIHIVGKDILRFHAVYWPAFLMAADIAPPKRIFAHGWWTIEGEKMSKSLGNVIAPSDLVARYGVDASRYFLLREVPFGSDGDFSHAQAIARINSDLANGLGNLAQRTLSFIFKNLDGKIPAPAALTAEDKALLELAQTKMLPSVRAEMELQRFNKAFELIWQVVDAGNVYIDAQAPWTLRKTENIERMNTVLYVLTEVIRCLAIIIKPIMPDSSDKMLDQLLIAADKRDFNSLNAENAIAGGTVIPAPQGIFPRLEDQKAA
jgi:methionyl-tRNA synthetase